MKPNLDPITRCNLCLEFRVTRSSHIIPDFFFRALKAKDADGRFLRVSNTKNEREYSLQRGITERLLCDDCEKRLQVFEDHLARVLRNKYQLTENNPSYTEFTGYNYKLLKNALVSILWRMSISKHAFFTKVDLGTYHEEFLRTSLLENALINDLSYPVFLYAPTFDQENELDQIIAPPDSMRLYKNRVVRFYCMGFVYTFIVGSAPVPDDLMVYALREKSCRITKSPIEKFPFLWNLLMSVGHASAKRDNQQPIEDQKQLYSQT